jgi:cobalt-zinc-cadmium efflux system membrane fusion protein
MISKRRLFIACVPLLLPMACRGHHEHGHSHGPSEHAAKEEAEGPALAITRWTDRYELFVELPAPTSNKPVPYHAHVTRLSDFGAVTEGTFTVRFKTSSGVAKEATQAGVKRPGIFVFESAAPGSGTYQLEMAYEHGGQTDVFDCGNVVVADKPTVAEVEEPGGAISFLKESQWKIPFATAWAAERPMARELEIPAVVEPAAGDQLTVGAPTGGRFFHSPKLVLAEGTRIKKGDVLGSIAPNVAGDDYSRLQFAVEEARLAVEQTQREIARVEPLVQQGLLPERRVLELRNELETHMARYKSAGGRLGRVDAPGGGGGLPIKSTLEGIISEVAVPNGEPVEAGAPLVRIGGTEHLWVRARFVAKPASLLVEPSPLSLRLTSGERVALEPLGARFVSALPVVDGASRVATWIVDIPTPQREASNSPAVPSDLRPGASVVLAVRFGKPAPALAVPRSALVEISTRPYVFVQFDGEHFEKRLVTVGPAEGDFVRIEAGIKAGERVVTRGGFDVHLASLLGTVESHRH